MAADYVFVGNHDIDFEVPGTLGVIYNYKKWEEHKKGFPFLNAKQYLSEKIQSDKMIIYLLIIFIEKRMLLDF